MYKRQFIDELEKRGITNVQVTQTGCIGICQFEPVVEVVTPGKDKVTYVKMTDVYKRQGNGFCYKRRRYS